MNKMQQITLFESSDVGSHRSDRVDTEQNGVLHFGSFDFGPAVDGFWGHDYEYDLSISADWKDTVLLLLIKEQFKSNSEFRKWADEKAIPYTSTC